MPWELNNQTPIYLQLTQKIALGIVAGRYAKGERIASVRDLASEAGVNPNTMQRAFAELETMGLVCAAERTAGRSITNDEAAIDALRKQMAKTAQQDYLAAMAKLGIDRHEAVKMLTTLKEEE